MGMKSRRKGMCGEREIVNLLKELGLKKVQRIPLSGSTPFQKGDVMIDNFLDCEVKRRKAINSTFYNALHNHNVVFVRADNKPWFVCLDLKFFTSLWKKANYEKSDTKPA